MIHRLLSIPLLPSDFLAEIKFLAQVNNIPIDVDELIRKTLFPPVVQRFLENENFDTFLLYYGRNLTN